MSTESLQVGMPVRLHTGARSKDRARSTGQLGTAGTGRRGPHTPLRGGDRLHGPRGRGPGHAGRSLYGSLLTLLAVVLALTVGLPTGARAETGSIRWNYDGAYLISKMTGSDGSWGYCAQNERHGPSVEFKEWHWVSDMDPAVLRGDPHGISWLLAHCYPLTSTFYGKSYDQMPAVHISQSAVWMYQGTMRQDRYQPNTGRTVDVSCTQAEADVAWALAQEAHTHDGEAGPWDHRFVYWVSPAGNAQNMFAIPPMGSLEVVKQSSESSLADGNELYGLEGAEFSVFSDKDCTNLVASLTTDDEGHASVDCLPAGTYYVLETKAPERYFVDTQARAIEVSAGQTATYTCVDTPQYVMPGLLLRKVDAQTGESLPQGDGALAGAQFRISYYPGSHTKDDLPDQALRSWVLRTDEKGEIALDQDHLVSGDALYTLGDGTPVLPLGTLRVTETQPPVGYQLNPEADYVLELTEDQAVRPARPRGDQTLTAVSLKLSASRGEPTVPAPQVPLVGTVREEALRGGIRVHKVDAETGQGTALGKASFAHTTFRIMNAGTQSVLVGDQSVAPGEVACTIEADDDGIAATAADALPYGTYLVEEETAGAGYQVNSSWSQTVQIRSEGQVATLEADTSCPDQVVRGDLSFVKEDANTGSRMAGVPFRITSLTTGESHVAVTDENGCLDTSAYPHSQGTDANDGFADDGQVASQAGVWFWGRTNPDPQQTIDDTAGALPFDDYRIEELPAKTNAGKRMVTIEASIRRDHFVVHLGTIGNQDGPSIHTTLTSPEGEHLVPADDGPCTLVDTVSYVGLTPGKSYELVGTLMDGDSGEPLADFPPRSMTFQPSSSSGTQEVEFSLGSIPDRCARIVAFEMLSSDGEKIASHEDMQDEDQTIRVARLRTTATNVKDDSHQAPTGNPVHLVDKVAYQNLLPQEEYTLVATLHLVASDGSDAGALLNPSGDVLTFEHSFIPDEASGTEDVDISFDASHLDDCDVVVFEQGVLRDHVVARHEDISDQDQTVSIRKGHIPLPDTRDPTSVGMALVAGCGGVAAICGGIALRRRR